MDKVEKWRVLLILTSIFMIEGAWAETITPVTILDPSSFAHDFTAPDGYSRPQKTDIRFANARIFDAIFDGICRNQFRSCPELNFIRLRSMQRSYFEEMAMDDGYDHLIFECLKTNFNLENIFVGELGYFYEVRDEEQNADSNSFYITQLPPAGSAKLLRESYAIYELSEHPRQSIKISDRTFDHLVPFNLIQTNLRELLYFSGDFNHVLPDFCAGRFFEKAPLNSDKSLAYKITPLATDDARTGDFVKKYNHAITMRMSFEGYLFARYLVQLGSYISQLNSERTMALELINSIQIPSAQELTEILGRFFGQETKQMEANDYSLLYDFLVKHAAQLTSEHLFQIARGIVGLEKRFYHHHDLLDRYLSQAIFVNAIAENYDKFVFGPDVGSRLKDSINHARRARWQRSLQNVRNLFTLFKSEEEDLDLFSDLELQTYLRNLTDRHFDFTESDYQNYIELILSILSKDRFEGDFMNSLLFNENIVLRLLQKSGQISYKANSRVGENIRQRFAVFQLAEICASQSSLVDDGDLLLTPERDACQELDAKVLSTNLIIEKLEQDFIGQNSALFSKLIWSSLLRAQGTLDRAMIKSTQEMLERICQYNISSIQKGEIEIAKAYLKNSDSLSSAEIDRLYDIAKSVIFQYLNKRIADREFWKEVDRSELIDPGFKSAMRWLAFKKAEFIMSSTNAKSLRDLNLRYSEIKALFSNTDHLQETMRRAIGNYFLSFSLKNIPALNYGSLALLRKDLIGSTKLSPMIFSFSGRVQKIDFYNLPQKTGPTVLVEQDRKEGAGIIAHVDVQLKTKTSTANDVGSALTVTGSLFAICQGDIRNRRLGPDRPESSLVDAKISGRQIISSCIKGRACWPLVSIKNSGSTPLEIIQEGVVSTKLSAGKGLLLNRNQGNILVSFKTRLYCNKIGQGRVSDQHSIEFNVTPASFDPDNNPVSLTDLDQIFRANSSFSYRPIAEKLIVLDLDRTAPNRDFTILSSLYLLAQILQIGELSLTALERSSIEAAIAINLSALKLAHEASVDKEIAETVTRIAALKSRIVDLHKSLQNLFFKMPVGTVITLSQMIDQQTIKILTDIVQAFKLTPLETMVEALNVEQNKNGLSLLLNALTGLKTERSTLMNQLYWNVVEKSIYETVESEKITKTLDDETRVSARMIPKEVPGGLSRDVSITERILLPSFQDRLKQNMKLIQKRIKGI